MADENKKSSKEEEENREFSTARKKQKLMVMRQREKMRRERQKMRRERQKGTPNQPRAKKRAKRLSPQQKESRRLKNIERMRLQKIQIEKDMRREKNRPCQVGRPLRNASECNIPGCKWLDEKEWVEFVVEGESRPTGAGWVADVCIESAHQTFEELKNSQEQLKNWFWINHPGLLEQGPFPPPENMEDRVKRWQLAGRRAHWFLADSGENERLFWLKSLAQWVLEWERNEDEIKKLSFPPFTFLPRTEGTTDEMSGKWKISRAFRKKELQIYDTWMDTNINGGYLIMIKMRWRRDGETEKLLVPVTSPRPLYLLPSPEQTPNAFRKVDVTRIYTKDLNRCTPEFQGQVLESFEYKRCTYNDNDRRFYRCLQCDEEESATGVEIPKGEGLCLDKQCYGRNMFPQTLNPERADERVVKIPHNNEKITIDQLNRAYHRLSPAKSNCRITTIGSLLKHLNIDASFAEKFEGEGLTAIDELKHFWVDDDFKKLGLKMRDRLVLRKWLADHEKEFTQSSLMVDI